MDTLTQRKFFLLSLCFLLIAFSTLFAQPSAPDLDDELILSGWNSAVGVTFDENGTLYVWEKGGVVYLVENGVKRNTPLLDLSDEVGNWRDFGMLGFALDPNYLNNGYIYCLYVVDRHFLLNYDEANPPGANYNSNADEYFNATIGRITRFTVSNPSTYGSASAIESSRHILIGDQIDNGFPILHQSHGVGTLLFGEDGTLIASCGDGASYFTADYGGPIGGTYTTQALADGIISNTENVGAFRSQLLSSLNGKIIRIDPVTGDGIPSNPFYDNNAPDAHQSRVWAMGFRNPFRMTLRPGTGSHYAGDGNPGALYVGDVGWKTWDEMDVVTSPGQNFGWPLYEGMGEVADYHANDQMNLDAPTPNACGGQSHFYFSELLKQSQGGGGNDPFSNPCGGGQINSNDANLFVHQKPTYTSAHQQALTKVSINGYVENVGNGQPNSVPGEMYPGNASVGGAWYVGTDFPAEYQNTYFHGDYSEKWIRNYSFDNNQVPEWVRPFDQDVPNKGAVVCIASDPINGGLYFIRYGSQLRQMVYNPTGNQKPTAVATQDTAYGTSPLTVQFDGSQSTDPEGNPLSYLWKFGDGSTSTQVSPTHTFTAGGFARTFLCARTAFKTTTRSSFGA
ncbi:MAG: PQQ-dependent sugar dehydrogenase [Bacteroidota bacterium]